MSAREEMLARIRSARAGAELVEPARDYRTGGEHDPGSPALIDLLADRLVDYKAAVRRCDDAGLRAAIAEALEQALAVTGGDVLISGLSFPGASDALEVPAGAYDLEVRPAGTTDVALALPGVQLEGGMVYDIFAIGQLSDGTLTVLVVPSMAAMPAATS